MNGPVGDGRTTSQMGALKTAIIVVAGNYVRNRNPYLSINRVNPKAVPPPVTTIQTPLSPHLAHQPLQ